MWKVAFQTLRPQSGSWTASHRRAKGRFYALWSFLTGGSKRCGSSSPSEPSGERSRQRSESNRCDLMFKRFWLMPLFSCAGAHLMADARLLQQVLLHVSSFDHAVFVKEDLDVLPEAARVVVAYRFGVSESWRRDEKVIHDNYITRCLAAVLIWSVISQVFFIHRWICSCFCLSISFIQFSINSIRDELNLWKAQAFDIYLFIYIYIACFCLLLAVYFVTFFSF